jgi:hypothetical protein
MDASTHTAFILEQQRAADRAREHALLASHRERRAAIGDARPARGHGIRSLFVRRAPQPACDRACLALAGPAA